MERPDKTPEKVSPGPRKWVVVAFVVSLEAIITAAIPILLIYLPVDFPLDEKIDTKNCFFFVSCFFRHYQCTLFKLAPPPLHFLQIIFSRLHCRKCFIFDTEFEESKTSSLFVAESTVLQIHFFP